MIQNTLISLFKRDLEQLINELSLYKLESNIWKTDKNIDNSAGNLSLHLIGNLNHFIGAVLGKTAYKRKRKLEFSQKNIAIQSIIQQLERTGETIENTITNISDEDLAKNYPIEVFNKPMTTVYFLIHLSTHLTYHLGQINYHRRLLDI
ncbi:MAG: DinB family protein [Flavobacteriales bacterium]